MERERVKVAINNISFTEGHRKTILDAIYPPSEPEKLPAGYYWLKIKMEGMYWACDKLMPSAME